jgi:hypothetical protein
MPASLQARCPFHHKQPSDTVSNPSLVDIHPRRAFEMANGRRIAPELDPKSQALCYHQVIPIGPFLLRQTDAGID